MLVDSSTVFQGQGLEVPQLYLCPHGLSTDVDGLFQLESTEQLSSFSPQIGNDVSETLDPIVVLECARWTRSQ
jgi:hypothetical protein